MSRKILILGTEQLEKLDSCFKVSPLQSSYAATFVRLDEYIEALKEGKLPPAVEGNVFGAVLFDEENLRTNPLTLQYITNCMECKDIVMGYIVWGLGSGADLTGQKKLYLGCTPTHEIKKQLDGWFEPEYPEAPLLAE